MVNDKDLKLVKCTSCSKSFYLKTKGKGILEIKCPYCEKEVIIKINGGGEDVSTRS